jgi:hypothetical protein
MLVVTKKMNCFIMIIFYILIYTKILFFLLIFKIWFLPKFQSIILKNLIVK